MAQNLGGQSICAVAIQLIFACLSPVFSLMAYYHINTHHCLYIPCENTWSIWKETGTV